MTEFTNHSKNLEFNHPVIDYLRKQSMIDNVYVKTNLCSNPNISISFIESMLYYYSYMQCIYRNPNITWSFVSKYSHIYNTCNISEKHGYLVNSNIFSGSNILYILKHISENNSNLELEILVMNRNFDKYNIDQAISMNLNIRYDLLSKNPNVSWEHVKSRFEKLKNYIIDIVTNDSVTWNDIKEILSIPYFYTSKKRILESFSSNYNISIDIVKDQTYIEYWNWHKLSANPSISFADILNNKTMSWDWDYVSQNPSVSITDILNNSDLPWNWRYISLNPSISISDIDRLDDKKWSHINISKNMFCHHPYYKSDKYKKILAKELFDKCGYDIIEKACDCKRIFNWNEDISEFLPEEYKKECVKYDKLFESIENKNIVVYE